MNRENLLHRLSTAGAITLLALSFILESPAQTPNTNPISPTLADFLRREGVRDPETGAILEVRPKVPRFSDNPPLDCSIRMTPPTNGVSQYEILLSTPQMTGTEIHERIVLDAEPSLLSEVSRQTKYRELAPVREARQREARTKRIAELTNRLLRYGMSKDEVVTAKGHAWKPGPPYQKAGASEMHYDDLTLLIDPVLVDACAAGHSFYQERRPAPTPLNKFQERSKLSPDR